ncbi:prepilin-type N-terminal cleavage/methylation domain-containing protein [Dehalococcoides mccartyi]|uniref:Tfp pilus assembly protein n=1 Tax=Dehalococcoides mccartyi (strain VS) TaxID=311424 RepID=D2BIU9_DEHMV|nr:prepilin-type N-terminal cleavage/methylation domain-containing protein [Dehalococcoides mccartyi]ACZ62249.1 Tfp pilus assembly protein [Dehalococcoides mccartyi VS]
MRRKLLGHQKGFSLIEVLIALAIIGLIGVAFLTALNTAVKAVSLANVRTTSESYAKSTMEQLKSFSYLSAADGSVADYTFLSPSDNSFIICTYNRDGNLIQNKIYGIPWDVVTNNQSTTDKGIQKITIVIQHNEGGVNKIIFTLIDYVTSR